MHAFLFDASSLVKRYAPEVGAAVVDYLFAQARSQTMRFRRSMSMAGIPQPWKGEA